MKSLNNNVPNKRQFNAKAVLLVISEKIITKTTSCTRTSVYEVCVICHSESMHFLSAIVGETEDIIQLQRELEGKHNLLNSMVFSMTQGSNPDFGYPLTKVEELFTTLLQYTSILEEEIQGFMKEWLTDEFKAIIEIALTKEYENDDDKAIASPDVMYSWEKNPLYGNLESWLGNVVNDPNIAYGLLQEMTQEFGMQLFVFYLEAFHELYPKVWGLVCKANNYNTMRNRNAWLNNFSLN